MIFDQSRRRVGIQVLDYGTIADIDLLALDHRWYRDNNCEIFGVTFEVVGHRDDGAIAVANEDDLRGLVVQVGVGLGDVEPAERLRGGGDHHRQDGGRNSNQYSHCRTPWGCCHW